MQLLASPRLSARMQELENRHWGVLLKSVDIYTLIFVQMGQQPPQ